MTGSATGGPARLRSRRELLAGAVAMSLAVVAGCGRSRGVAEVPGIHPALRPPGPAGEVAMLAAAGDAATVRGGALELSRRAGSDLMVGIAAGFFDATGLPSPRPPGFGPMPEFPGDLLIPQRTGAAVIVQVEGDSAAAVGRRADAVLAGLPGLTVSWRTPVSRVVAGTEHGRALQRNTFGFVEGLGNPSLAADAADQVLIRAGQPWTIGGSILAVRVIRMAHDLWRADSVGKQERIIGRRTDGRWLDGTSAFTEPRFEADPEGAVTPLDSHVRKVNPRTPGEPPPRLLRRSWSYRGGTAPGGVPDEGLVFMAFQNDLAAGFVRAQERLRGEAMAPYLLAVGGGYFIVPTAEGLARLLGD